MAGVDTLVDPVRFTAGDGATTAWPYASVLVNVHGGSAASLFTDATLSKGLPNPLLAGSSGDVQFYVAPGDYDLVATAQTGQTLTTYVTVAVPNVGPVPAGTSVQLGPLPSGDTTGVTDTANLQAAINTAAAGTTPGSISRVLIAGNYVCQCASGPGYALNLPANVELVGFAPNNSSIQFVATALNQIGIHLGYNATSMQVRGIKLSSGSGTNSRTGMLTANQGGSANQAELYDPYATFTAGNIGQAIVVRDGGTAGTAAVGGDLQTTIASVVDAQHVLLTANAGAAGTFAQTTIAVGSNGAALPQNTINVASTANFPASGVLLVASTAAQMQVIFYTGTTATSFTGCSGYSSGSGLAPSGTLATGGTVALVHNYSYGGGDLASHTICAYGIYFNGDNHDVVVKDCDIGWFYQQGIGSDNTGIGAQRTDIKDNNVHDIGTAAFLNLNLGAQGKVGIAPQISYGLSITGNHISNIGSDYQHDWSIYMARMVQGGLVANNVTDWANGPQHSSVVGSNDLTICDNIQRNVPGIALFASGVTGLTYTSNTVDFNANAPSNLESFGLTSVNDFSMTMNTVNQRGLPCYLLLVTLSVTVWLISGNNCYNVGGNAANAAAMYFTNGVASARVTIRDNKMLGTNAAGVYAIKVNANNGAGVWTFTDLVIEENELPNFANGVNLNGPNAATLTGGAVTTGTNAFTASAGTAMTVGNAYVIVIPGAGPGGNALITTITATGTLAGTLAANASTTVAAASCTYGYAFQRVKIRNNETTVTSGFAVRGSGTACGVDIDVRDNREFGTGVFNYPGPGWTIENNETVVNPGVVYNPGGTDTPFTSNNRVRNNRTRDLAGGIYNSTGGAVNVHGSDAVYLTTSAAVTSFTGGFIGERRTVVAQVGATQLTNSASLVTASGANVTLAANQAVTVAMVASGVWAQV